MCDILGLTVSQDSNVLCHYGEEVLFPIYSTNGWGRNAVRNAFWLNPLLLLSLDSLLQLRHFHLWESDLTEKALIPLGLLLLFFPDFFFLSGIHEEEEWLNILNPLTAWGLIYFLELCCGFQTLCWVEEWFVRCLFSGVPSCSHSSLACCRKHSLIHLTHWCLLMIYKDQPKNPHIKMNQ